MGAKVLDEISAVGAGLSQAAGLVDIKDDYLHIPIFSCPQRFLQFVVEECQFQFVVVWFVNGSQSVDQGPCSGFQAVLFLRPICLTQCTLWRGLKGF